METCQRLFVLDELFRLRRVDVRGHIRVIGLVVEHVVALISETFKLFLRLFNVLVQVVVGAAVFLTMTLHLLPAVIHRLELVVCFLDHFLKLFESLSLNRGLRRLRDLTGEGFDILPRLSDFGVVFVECFRVACLDLCRRLIDLIQRFPDAVKTLLN